MPASLFIIYIVQIKKNMKDGQAQIFYMPNFFKLVFVSEVQWREICLFSSSCDFSAEE